VFVLPIASDVAAAYLARDVGGNVEPLVSLRHDEDVLCRGVITDDRVIGVLVAGRQWPGGPLTAMIETGEREVLVALAGALPTGVTQLALHRPWMLPVLETCLRITPVPRDELLVLTASALALPALPAAPEVRLLTEADTAVVVASSTPWGLEGFTDALRHGYRPFGVVRGERVLARAMAAYTTGYTEEVSAVWTAPAWRGKGLATIVAATVAADILSRVPLATYTVRPFNLASQRVAAKTGFVLDHRTHTYPVHGRR